MTESSRRAVLLARPGAACERLRSALSDAGAQLVLEADPTTLDPAVLLQSAPQVVVVALDPVTEDIIERFDPVLADSSVEVIYEEAALAASREGWDLARWSRHLSAKLQGHGDVLPPGHEPEDAPVPEHPQTPAVEAIAAVPPPLPPAPAAAAPAPVVSAAIPPPLPPVPTPVAPAPVPPALPPVVAAAPRVEVPAMTLEPIVEAVATPVAEPIFETIVETIEMETSAVEVTLAEEPRTQFSHDVSYRSPFDPVAAEASFDASESNVAAPVLSDFEFTLADEPVVAIESDGVTIAPFESSFDFEVVDNAPSERAAPAQEPVLLFDASRPPAADETATPASDVVAAPVAAAPAAPDWSFSDDAPVAAPAARAATSDRFQRDLGNLSERISTMELVDDRPAVALDGAVLVLAGIGGPDAVRQLLGALPEGFPRPVLVQQRLDGGRYDRLVAQMQRATPLQVRLAEPGLMAMPGTIYILPGEIGLAVSESGMRFTEGDGDVLAALPSADSAVLMFSGSDPARVDAAMNHSWGGALVAGQAPDGCYDAAAASALISRGAQSGQPADLAARLAQRWR